MNKISAKVSPCSSSPPPALLHPSSSTEDDNPITESLQEQEPGPGRRSCQCQFRVVLRLAAGVVLGVCMASSWTWAAHSARRVLTRFRAPFFITCFCSSWNLLMFPLYYTSHVVASGQREMPAAHFRRCVRLLGEGEVTVRVLLRLSAPFSLFWSISVFLYLLALTRISVSDCSAVLCCTTSFIFLLAWIGLKERFMGVRVVAAILSITGIVMLAYADGFHSDSITGVALGVGSASSSAVYQVLYRKRVGVHDVGVACVLLCCVGVCVLFLHSWVCVLLYVTHVEFWPPSEPVPWSDLCTTASLMLVYNVIVNMGGVCSYPSLTSLGILITIPVSTAVDVCMFEAPVLNEMRLASLALISAAFLMLMFPEDWTERMRRCFSSLWNRDEKSTAA
ncbi:solute carrier family 35 member F4 [Trichomycterus rosablanca]|uniref:solute carrier family 35 member F4 n=1 Tax=Trichomycterus rosablanca TaxID=2290929 RepID=UPI002F35F796